MTLSKEGGCRCGRVRFRISAPTLLTMACHCVGCQRMSGSAFSLSDAIPGDGFSVISGKPVIGGMRQTPAHYFCPYCMSWIFTRPPEVIGDFVNVRSTMLDHPAKRPPFVETWTREKLPWAATSAAHSFEEFPPVDAFADLVREYASLAG